MVDEFSVQFTEKQTARTPAAPDLFEESSGELLNPEKREEFHTFTAKGLFACKRARLDIHTAVSALCTRVREPKTSDWEKLIRLMKYLKATRRDKMRIRADDLTVVKWYVDASFAVHPDFRSHTGGYMKFGDGIGTIQSVSRKQKLNTRSSTEAELVGADDVSQQILWTKLFLEEQGIKIEKNILYQDNKAAILLETNGKRSSGAQTRALNIRYFFMHDQVQRGNVSVEYCSTTDMIADFFTKPLQGNLFQKFRRMVMGYGNGNG